jgi:RNA polymerase sigma factor (sigma-70 family)
MPPEPTVDTAQLHGWLDRMKAGDPEAREDLLRHLCGRLERLARKMLRRFPRVGQWVETDDVLQNSLLRLLRALEEVRPSSLPEFFGLAAEQMRRELIDLARHYFGPRGPGSHTTGGDFATTAPEPADPHEEDRADLERWCRFHEEVARLPAQEREVVNLIFYHAWTQLQVAELFQVSDRTVRRRWESAMVQLYEALGMTNDQ